MAVGREATRLAAAIDGRRTTVLDNAFQRALAGTYSRFPLHAAVFEPLALPDGALPAVRDELVKVRDALCIAAHRFLVEVSLDLAGGEAGGRVLRGERGSRVEVGRADVEAAVSAFLGEGGAGAAVLRSEFDLCFGRIGGASGPFGSTGLRRLFEEACRECLEEHLLGPAQDALRARDGGGQDVKVVLKDLVRSSLGDVYEAVEGVFAEAVLSELRARATRLHKRLACGRVRKGGPLVAVHLAQCCLDSAMPSDLQDGLGDGAGAVVEGGADSRAAEEIRLVAARVAELAGPGAADVEQEVGLWRTRRLADWEKLGINPD